MGLSTNAAAPVPGVDGWPPHPVEVAPWTVPNREEKRGYERKRKRLTLAFDDHATLDGLEIICRSVPMGVAFELAILADTFNDEADAKAKRAAGLQLAQEFVQLCEDWNYRDEDGRQVELTPEFLLAEFDPDEFLLVLSTWQQASTGTAAPLPQTSADGPPSVEAQIPMDVPSESRAS